MQAKTEDLETEESLESGERRETLEKEDQLVLLVSAEFRVQLGLPEILDHLGQLVLTALLDRREIRAT
jgi:hypothetical protein